MTKRLLLLNLILLVISGNLFCQQIIISEDINNAQTWQDTVIIQNSISIYEDILVEPGTVILISDNVVMNFFSSITANGTQNDSILFTSKDNNWAGIEFKSTDAIDSAIFKFCIIENSNSGAIKMIRSGHKLIIRNCILRYNRSVKGGAIYTSSGRALEVSNSIFYHNVATSGGAISTSCYPTEITNSNFIYNDADQGGAIWVYDLMRIVFSNNIIWENTNALYGQQLYPTYCIIQGGTSFGKGIITSNPKFKNIESFDLSLRNDSPAIDSGCPCGNLDQDGSLPDIGAIPFLEPRLYEIPYEIIKDSILSGELKVTQKPYLVCNDLKILKEDTLLIGEGVNILFDGNYQINSYGRFELIGSKNQEIVLNALDTSIYEFNGYFSEGGWGGINFYSKKVNISYTKFLNIGIQLNIENRIENPYFKSEFLDSNGLAFYNIDSINIRNIFIQSSYVSNGSDGQAYLMRVENCNNLIIDSLYFENTILPQSSYQNGIFINNSNALVKNSEFENSAIERIILTENSNVELYDNVFQNNFANPIYITGGGKRTLIIRNKFIKNIGRNRLYIDEPIGKANGYSEVSHNLFYNNYGETIDGILFIKGGVPLVHSNVFIENKYAIETGSVSTAGIWIESSYKVNNKRPKIFNNTFIHNQTGINGVGGIYTLNSEPLVQNNLLHENYPEDFRWHNAYNGAGMELQDPILKNNLIGVNPSLKFGSFDTLGISFDFNSPAIDAGDTSNITIPSYDFFGNGRLDDQTRIIDIGAFELMKENTPPNDISFIQLHEYIQPINTLIGEFRVDDDDELDIYILTIDNDNFRLDNSKLVVNSTLIPDFEYSIVVTAVEMKGDTITKEFKLSFKENVLYSKKQNENLLIYPNPASEFITLSKNQKIVVILDSSGKYVGGWIFDESKRRIDVTGFKTGIYYLVLSNGRNEKIVNKLIIQK